MFFQLLGETLERRSQQVGHDVQEKNPPSRGPSSLIEKATYASKVVEPTGVDKLRRFS